MSFYRKGTDGRRKEEYIKRLSYPGTCRQTQKENRALGLCNGCSLLRSHTLTSFRRVSPYQLNEGLFNSASVLEMTSTNGGTEYGSDSELEIDSEPPGSRSLPPQLTPRSPLMENTSLLNQQPSHHHQKASNSATAFNDSGADTPQNMTIIAMLQQQLQEVISMQQGMLKKQSDFDNKLVSLQNQVSEGLNLSSSITSSSDEKLHVI